VILPAYDRFWRFLPVVVGVAMLSSQGSSWAQTQHQAAPPVEDPAPSTSKKNNLNLNPYEKALEFKQTGRFDEAIKLLEVEANRGVGYEVAQLTLGECYIESAARNPDPEAAGKGRKTGLGWIIRAAASGHPGAQVELIHLTLEGGNFRVEPAEAGKWYYIWKNNPTRYASAASQLDPKLIDRLQKTLTDADWTEAKKRADAWFKGS
jgi:TPR repeat protein